MNCPHCSTVNPDYAESCSRCGTPMPVGDSETMVMTDAALLTPGQDFGPRYRIESLLGQGGMGRVYKAYDKDLDRIVAIKVVRQGALSESDALKRFKQELLLASKISHKNILRIHDMGDVGGIRFISMAYVEGPDLHHIISDNPKMPLDRVLNFARQFAEALAAAHAEGVIHRDLKPQNILVGKDDQIYVSDFGLAKSFEEGAVAMTKTGAFLGTPRYMSPEQVEGKPADHRSDLYAYGLILYELVTGDVPFTGESTLKVMYQRVQEKPKSPKLVNPDLPNWLVRVILHCLERAPEARYQNAYEILADLQGGSRSGSAVSRAGSQTVVIQIPEFAQRRWTWWVAGGVALLLLLLVIPPVRHLIFHSGGGGGTGTSAVSGVPPLSTGRYVAVLPLQVLGDQARLGYLAQGIQEALSAKLFELKDVHVTSTDEASKADQSLPLPKIGRNLGANLLVLGTLQGSGDKVRIVVKVEDVADGKGVWSKEFDGVTDDLFTLEDEIYTQVVSALNVSPSNEETANAEARPTENIAAYDLYLRGQSSLRKYDSKDIQVALDYFNQALKADHTFALAYTGIASASLRMYGNNKEGFWIQKAVGAAQQAEQLNDKLPEVHSTLGGVYIALGKNSEAVAELKRAISLAPNSDQVYRRMGSAYLAMGQATPAIEAFQKAIQLNPYYWVSQNELGDAYYQLGNYPKALEAFQQVTVLEPDINVGYENVGNIYLQEAKYQDAIPYFQKALQVEPYWSTYSNLGTAYFFLKQYTNSTAMYEKAVELNPNDTLTLVNLADSYRGAGEQDKARKTYERAINAGFNELRTNPQDAGVMDQMAASYAKTGNAQQADTFIRRARAIDKNNVNYIYDEAKIDALLGRKSEALGLVREALEKHYPAQFAAGDPDLQSIQGDPAFAAIIKKYSGGAKP
jgi:serine/threonine protein kinase/tetratricopeptide (TPR) repeat protein